jgi:hypothetical protein
MGGLRFVPLAGPPHFRVAMASGSPQVHRLGGCWSAHQSMRRGVAIPLKIVVNRMSG